MKINRDSKIKLMKNLVDKGWCINDIADIIPEYRVREYYDFATANKNEDEDNLNYVKLSLDKYEEVFKLGVSGYSIKEIAKMVGVSGERLNSELLPCPFCGGKAEIRNETVMEPPVHYEVVFVTCLECGASTTRKISDGYYGLRCGDDEIAEMWNRRVRED